MTVRPMHRTPPRRQPRVAALVPSRRVYVLVVLDAWEVRAMAITRSALRLRHLLRQERPVLVVGTRLPAWLKRSRVRTAAVAAPRQTLSLAAMPELRRFAGTEHEPAVRQALTLADEALTDPAYDPRLSQD